VGNPEEKDWLGRRKTPRDGGGGGRRPTRTEVFSSGDVRPKKKEPRESTNTNLLPSALKVRGRGRGGRDVQNKRSS